MGAGAVDLDDLAAAGKGRSWIGTGDDLAFGTAFPASGLRRPLIPTQNFLDARNQLSAVKGLHQEGRRSSRLRSPLELRLRKGRDDDDRKAVTFCPEAVLEIETAHSRQLDIRNEA